MDPYVIGDELGEPASGYDHTGQHMTESPLPDGVDCDRSPHSDLPFSSRLSASSP